MVTLHDRIIELGGCSLLYQSVKLINDFMGDTSFLIKAMISPMARCLKISYPMRKEVSKGFLVN